MYCPTNMLVVDFYKKPLQGKQFRIFRNFILKLDEPSTSNHIKADTIEKNNPTCSDQYKTKKNGTKIKLQVC